MDLSELETIRKHSALVIRKICEEYGLYGNVIYYAPSPITESNRNRLYIIAGTDPAIGQDPPPKWLKPDEIIRRNERNNKLFYCENWAFDLFENRNDIQAQQDLVDYCKNVNLLKQVYSEYGLSCPTKIRYSEISLLSDYRSVLDNPAANTEAKRVYTKALNRFFKRENSDSKFRKKWLDYYRSEKFPDDKGSIAKFMGFLNRNKNTLNLIRQLEVNGDIHKLQMQEHEYKLFSKFMTDCYPDVSYSAGDVSVVNHGLTKTPLDSINPLGRAVTGEEFSSIRKERFATEGFASLADLRPAYWEFRDVYYKACDEPLVASAYNSVTLTYAKCNSLMELKERGDLKLEKIPASDFMNFVSLAKSNGLRFYIDNLGDFDTPSLKYVNVVYNNSQTGLLRGITDRMVSDKVEYSHMLSTDRSPLNTIIHSIENTSKRSSDRLLSSSRDTR